MSDSGKNREVIEGVVASAKSQKTIAVSVMRDVRHPKYGKVMRKKSIFYAHDEKGEAREGDRVAISSTRPLSKTKRWRLVKIIEKADLV
jgi:small subunit ribosomal protein S17